MGLGHRLVRSTGENRTRPDRAFLSPFLSSARTRHPGAWGVAFCIGGATALDRCWPVSVLVARASLSDSDCRVTDS